MRIGTGPMDCVGVVVVVGGGVHGHGSMEVLLGSSGMLMLMLWL